jgi:hypothetical protein
MRIFKSSKINYLAYQCFTAFIVIILMAATGNCFAMREQKDSIDNLSFSHDGKKVIFDRCREACQVQVYNLETGELAAYQSPANERWTMAKQSYDAKKIVFSVMPVIDGHVDLSEMQIAVMDADGKNYKKVTTGPGAKLSPTFSHSGNKVLYARAAYMRKSGKTPAAQYDAWEVDLTTGTQTQLTFFKYFYMGYLTYFPDDERFVYYGELPEAFPGLDLPKGEPRKAQEMIRQEQMKRKIGIAGILVMKRGEDLPQRHYNFGKGFNAERPLLSKDGSKLIVEKSASAGEFYLYSQDGNHRLAVYAGPSVSASVSPDGGLFAMIAASSATIDTFAVGDGKRKPIYYLPCAPHKIQNWENAYKGSESLYKIMPEKPSRILNK